MELKVIHTNCFLSSDLLISKTSVELKIMLNETDEMDY